jgi:glycosyltransferase involved in cell wall biosynthesis
MPKFSILIPIIKSKFLATAIESVLKQTFSDWELILYNDCSSENIEDVVEKYTDKRIKYFKGEVNLGADDPSKTWNHILSLAEGKFVCLLGDDDYISENYLEEMNLLIEKFPDTHIFRALLKRVNEKNEIISTNGKLPKHETWYQEMNERNIEKRMQSTCEFVLKRDQLIEVGGYVNFPRACGSDDASYLLLAKERGIVSTNKAVGYWRKSSLNISDNDSQEMNAYKIKYYLEWERNFLDKMLLDNVSAYELYDFLDIEKKQKLQELDNAKREIELVKQEIESTNHELKEKEKELTLIYTSREWKFIIFLQKIVKVFIPAKSLRRKIVVESYRLIKFSIRFFKKIIRKIKSAFFLSKNYFLKFKPKKKRKINKVSKKIVYIGHSYHNKTKSTEFLINYLKEFYEVEIILDESWRGQGEEYPDLSFIDENYLGVIFFQNLPNNEILKNIKNDNIIFFPMYDGVGHDFDFWKSYFDLKIINFSTTLHKKLSNWGFESLGLQYFPKPSGFIAGKREEVFFWQRLTRINIDLISKLFEKNKFNIHIHKAVDPNQQFQQPNWDQEKKFEITYSDWFETRSEMWDLIKQKAIYIAPRELEGIGQSFLEAMAMGKAVVAVNNPTMNEYIENGKTGYLFDLKNPKEIDFSNIEDVQKNTYEYMKKGYEKWEKDKKKIIEFIEKA